MIELKVQDFQWIQGSGDDPQDQCAHGRVQLKVNDTEFVKPEAGIWTVSASALYLLRTLSENHTVENPVSEGNLLFPCCGFNVDLRGIRFKVLCTGCPNGVDVEVLHQGDMILIRSSAGSESVPKPEWVRAVLSFVDSVHDFYQVSLPKVAIEDEFDRQGWAAFWQEWSERYSLAMSSSG